MNQGQVTACRKANIERLARLGNRDEFEAKHLYNRCVRFCLRWNRWATINVSENLKGFEKELHDHEGELLKALWKRLDDDLKAYGLKWEFPGLYPVLEHENLGCHWVELYWY